MAPGHDSRHNWGMHWIETHGVKLPKPLGGHPALDFCNTWAGWGERSSIGDDKREWLRDYDTLAVWTGYAGLADDDRVEVLRAQGRREPGSAARVLERARALRAAVHDAVLAPADARALGDLGVELRRAGALLELRPADGGPATWSIAAAAAGLELPVLAVAWSAAGLLTSPDIAKVAACPGVDCGWMFIDVRGRRRWCDMAACGNRAKVAAHARRTRERASASA